MTQVLDGAVLDDALTQAVVDRLIRPDYPAFEEQLRSSGYCAQPVRLQGRVEVCDGHGRRQQVWTTDSEPDGVLRKACGNRREAICGPCAERYRGDALQLIAAGLRGGKGIPESVMGHPAVFATLTAPSFGPVHAHLLGPDGEPVRCRPRRERPVCEHGNALSCARVHGRDDPCLGEPVCPDCFDYEGVVVWNNLLGELWRRSIIYLPRRLAGLVGITQKRLHEQVRVSYVKVAEYQRRGLVHLHALIRLDKRMPAYRADELRAPAKRFTVQLLEQALRAAVKDVKVEIPKELGAGTIRWGKQLDVEQLSTDEQERPRRAGYLAKYTTKSTEQAGGLLRRITREEVEHVPVSEHNRGYLRTAFTLHDRVTDAIAANPAEQPVPPPPRPAPATSEDPNDLVLRVLQAMSTDERVTVRMHRGDEHVGQITRRTVQGLVLDTGIEIKVAEVCAITAAPLQPPARDKRDRRLAACAHTYGHRGHCLTKSRKWSVRLKDLRQARADHVHEQLLSDGDDVQRALAELAQEQRIGRFEFVGVGHLTTADALLAAQAASRAREHRELAREALYDHQPRRGGPMRDNAGSPAASVSQPRPAVGPGEFEPFLTAREVAERLRVAPCTVLLLRRWRAARPPAARRTLPSGALSLERDRGRPGLRGARPVSSRGQARTGELKRTAGGWAIRYRDGRGVRRQRGGFRTKAEAKQVLDDELRKARLGPLYRPEATLQELVDVFFEQYQAAPASHAWMRQHLGKSTAVFGDVPIGELDALVIARWRAGLPETMRHGAHRALRQVLAAAVRWQWIDRNVATDLPNPMHPRMEFDPFDSWEEVDALAHELGPFGPLAIFSIGTGVRPEEAFGADWTDVDLQAGIFTVRRAFAKGRLKPYPKTERSRRRVPLRARVVDALGQLRHREGVLFSAAGGGRVDINNFRSREWLPALEAAGVRHRRIYDMRHTFATWSLAAGMSIFTLARRMGTSLQMIDRTYGHLAQDAEDQDRDLLDAYDTAARNGGGHVVGTEIDGGESS